MAGPELLGGVSDQGRIPASRPGRGWPAPTERPGRSAHEHAGSDGLHRSARRRHTRAVNAQPSLFDEADQPTDPRSIDPGGAPLPQPNPRTPAHQPIDPPAGTVQSPAVSDEPTPAAEQRIEEFTSPTDFPASLDTLVPSGSKARIRANIAAVQLLRALQDAQRPATPAEQRVLATWSGWGAVPQVFDPAPATSPPNGTPWPSCSIATNTARQRPPSSTPTTPIPPSPPWCGKH